MEVVKNKEQTISFIGVLVLAILLPSILKLTNSATRYLAGAEGRLAAISVDTNSMEVSGEGTWVTATVTKNNEKYEVVLKNNDTKGVHSEVVPVTFLGLSKGKYEVTMNSTKEVVTNENIIQKQVPMTPNSTAVVELMPL